MRRPANTVLLWPAGIVFEVRVGSAAATRAAQRDVGREVRQEPQRVGQRHLTYRERLALTPGATLVADLRDVSYADGPAPLIARQAVSGPGQVPIRFEVGYSRDDIESRNVYSVSARIIESDGRLAFTNDTAHDVITRGKPNKVDMVLVLVQPPPDASGGDAGSDWRTWVETPVPVVWANLIPNEREHLLRVAYYQSTLEGCVRPGN